MTPTYTPRTDLELTGAGRAAVTDLLLVISLVCGSFALSNQFTMGSWLIEPVLVLLAISAILTWFRSLNWSDIISTGAALVLALTYLVSRYSAAAGEWHWPQPKALQGFVANLQAAGEVINVSAPPVPAVWPVQGMLSAVLLLLFILSDCFAVGLKWPLVAGLVPLTFWIPGLAMEQPGPFWPAIVVVAAGLLLLYHSANSSDQNNAEYLTSPTSQRAPASVISTTVILTLILALVITPHTTNLPGWRWLFETDNPFNPISGSVNLSDVLSMDQDLGQQTGRTVFSYTTTDPQVTPRFRLFASSTYDGNEWLRPDPGEFPTAEYDLTQRRTLWPKLYQVRGNTEIDLFVGDLATQDVPLPAQPRDIQTDLAGLGYIAQQDVLYYPAGPVPAGQHFRFTVQGNPMSGEDLRGRGFGELTDPLTQQPYIDQYEAQIADLARRVTRGARNHYDAAMAIQEYLKNSPHFRYSTRVGDPVTGSAVWDFLNDGRGYCVQFATAMVQMLRSLGIPSRMAVGFLPGQRGEDGIYQVTGRQAHTWPEVYFDGYGWVAFEPTPAVHTGSAPQWAQPTTTASGSPTPTPTPTASATSTPTSTQSAAPTTATSTPAATATTDSTAGKLVQDWGPTFGISALSLLTAIAGWALLRRRRMRARTVQGVELEEVYDDLRRKLAKVGITWQDSATGAQVQQAILGQETVVEFLNNQPAMARQATIGAVKEWSDLMQILRYAKQPPRELGRARQLANEIWTAVRTANAGRDASSTSQTKPPDLN